MGVLKGKIVLLFIISLLLYLPVQAENADTNPASSGASVQNDFSEYMNTLQGQIQKNWNPPDFLEKDGHATIMFSINRCGDIISTQIVESSGDAVFDESAMEALRKASPFNHFPANTSKGSLTIKYSFDTSIVKTDNMQEYVKNADRYYNINNHQTALNYINRAIEEVEGDSRSYFLYGKRSKIKRALGDVDGANPLTKHMTVTLPHLMPTIGLVTTISSISAMKVFAEIYVMTKGGPLDSSKTIVYYIYERAFENLDLGIASAASVILLVIVLAISIINFVFFERKRYQL